MSLTQAEIGAAAAFALFGVPISLGGEVGLDYAIRQDVRAALNIILGPGIGFGVASNSISTEFGAQLTGTFDAADAYTLFGADITLIGSKVPVGLVIFTNLGSYSFNNLDIPLATTGSRFFGIGLSNAGEYLTGFRFTISGSATALLLDRVAVGHVAVNVNANPQALVGGPYTGLEGSAVALAMSGTDTDADGRIGP